MYTLILLSVFDSGEACCPSDWLFSYLGFVPSDIVPAQVLTPFHWLASVCIPQAFFVWICYSVVWFQLHGSHPCLSCLLCAAFSWKADGWFYSTLSWVVYENTVGCWKQAAVCWYLSLWCGWILLKWWVCPSMSNVMCGDPWCHPDPAAEVLHPSCVSLNLSSSIFPIEKTWPSLSSVTSVPQQISRPSFFFFSCPDVTLCWSMIVPVWLL